jgi:O-antigen/teichoic acid export membrane protein
MNKYLRAISANIIFFVISGIFFIAITPFAFKVMGEEFYGLWSVLLALMLFSNVGSLGIDTIVMKFASETPAQGDAQMQNNRVMTAGYLIVFAMSLITAVILLLARNPVADNINTSIELKGQFRLAILWIAASVFPQFLACVPRGFLLSQLLNREARIIELFSSILLWLGAIVITFFEKNLVSIAVWCLFSNLLVFGLYFWVVQRVKPLLFQPDVTTLRKMLNFSGYMFLESLAITMFSQLDRVIVSFTLGPALAGVYSIGTSLASRLSMATGQATAVMTPYASLKESLSEQQKLYLTFRQLSRYISLMLAGISGFLIIWMHEILSIWISTGFATCYAETFRILIIAYTLLSLSRPAHQTLTGLGKVKITSLVYLSLTVAMLAGVYILSFHFGLNGAASANCIMGMLLVYNLFVYHDLAQRIPWKAVLSDLKWGLFIPIIIYNLLFLNQAITVKLLLTIILGIIVLMVALKDDWVRVWLWHRVKYIVHK